MKYIRERKKESVRKILEHTRVGVAMINTEQVNSNSALLDNFLFVFSRIGKGISRHSNNNILYCWTEFSF